jgi:hypothetical protein
MESLLDHVSLHRSTHKSNAALLLTLFVPVSLMLRYSYKKIGGVPHPVDKDDLFEVPRGSSKPDPVGNDKIVDIVDTDPQCFLSLTDYPANARPKRPQCFLSLTDRNTRNYQCFLSLTKMAGGGSAVCLPMFSIGMARFLVCAFCIPMP